jgi:hypothetical protein
LPDFSWYKIPKRDEMPNDPKMYQMAIDFTNRIKNIPNGHKTYQHLPLQDPPKFTPNGMFGFKLNHLATLVE